MRRVYSLAIPRMWRRRVLSTVALTFVVMFGLAPNAYADVIAKGSGVRGRSDWSWGVHELTHIYLGVRDLACDGHPVFVHLRVYYDNNTLWYDDLRRDHNGGCRTAKNWHNLYTNTGAKITAVQVVACVNKNNAGDTCYRSARHDNPLT
jgi:hypothetical protein